MKGCLTVVGWLCVGAGALIVLGGLSMVADKTPCACERDMVGTMVTWGGGLLFFAGAVLALIGWTMGAPSAPTSPFRPDYSGLWTESSIMAVPDGKVGVYGVHSATATVFIGMGDLKARLLEHFKGDNPCIVSRRPTGWIAEVTDTPDERGMALMRYHHPPCNPGHEDLVAKLPEKG